MWYDIVLRSFFLFFIRVIKLLFRENFIFVSVFWVFWFISFRSEVYLVILDIFCYSVFIRDGIV